MRQQSQTQPLHDGRRACLGVCREEGRVHQSGPSRTGGLKGGVQRSGGSSWGLPPVTEAELDVQRSMASLRSLMSMSEKPPSRLARMSSIAFSKRHVSIPPTGLLRWL